MGLFNRTPSRQIVVNFELLQNGIPVATKSFDLAKRARLTLGARERHSLQIPHYPFSRALSLARLKAGRLFITLPMGWEGTIIAGGQRYNYGADKKQNRKIPRLATGDYGFIHKNDLCVMFRVTAKSNKRVPRSVLKFPAPLWSLGFHITQDIHLMGVASSLAAISVLLFAYALTSKTVKRPQTLRDIAVDDALAFIYPLHFANIPEALQDRLDRRDYRTAAVDFAEGLTSMIAPLPLSHRELLFENSVRLNNTQFFKRRKALAELMEAAQKRQDTLLAKPYRAIVQIPAVKGESIRGTALRLFDKIDMTHESLTASLANRRQVIEDYQLDPEYDFSDYKRGSFKQSKKAKDALSKISPFAILTNEEEMYHQAGEFAKRAMGTQLQRAPIKSTNSLLLDASFATIDINVDTEGLGFLDLATFSPDDQKINALVASELNGDTTSQPKIREPLIGEISLSSVEQHIKRRLYELRLCYELALRRDAKAAGSMEWRWRIDSQGEISDIALVSSSIKDIAMTSCIKNKIASWILPKPKRGSVEISYPFVFAKDHG